MAECRALVGGGTPASRVGLVFQHRDVYWFAADHHTEFGHAYASRGNIFSIVALALLAASVSVIVGIIRSSKKRRTAKA